MNERNVQLDGQPPFGTLRLPTPVDSFRSFANMLKGNAISRRLMPPAHGGGLALSSDLIAETSPPHVDVLKLDIEGVEFPVVEAFFASAPQRLRPRMIILEVGKNNTTTEAYTHCIEHGYTQIRRTQLNAILHWQSNRMPQFDEKNR